MSMGAQADGLAVKAADGFRQRLQWKVERAQPRRLGLIAVSRVRQRPYGQVAGAQSHCFLHEPAEWYQSVLSRTWGFPISVWFQ